jgi:hypothetical protein
MSKNFGGNRIKISDFSQAQVNENLSQSLTELLLLIGWKFLWSAQGRKNSIICKQTLASGTRRDTKRAQIRLASTDAPGSAMSLKCWNSHVLSLQTPPANS